MLAVVVGLCTLLALEVGAETLLAIWARTPSRAWAAAIGVGMYALVGLVFGLLMHWRGDLATTNALWQAGNVCLVTLVGVLFFKDRPKPVEWVGVSLAALATICFVIGR